MLYVGEGLRGSNGAHPTLHRISVFHSATHNQTGPLRCWFRSGWACACHRPLWVSPMTSPVRLGVSPAAAQPPRAFSIKGLRLYFPALEPWVTQSASLPAFCLSLSVRKCGASGCYPPLCLPRSPPLWVRPSRFICANVGPQGLLVVRLPALFVPHSTSLSPATATRVLSAPPTGLDECLFFISLVSDFLVFRFSVSSGCARRHSVSTYAAILVLPLFFQISFPFLALPLVCLAPL